MFFVQIYGDGLLEGSVYFYVPHYSSGGHIVFVLSVGWLVDLFTPTLTFAITFAILKIAT